MLVAAAVDGTEDLRFGHTRQWELGRERTGIIKAQSAEKTQSSTAFSESFCVWS